LSKTGDFCPADKSELKIKSINDDCFIKVAYNDRGLPQCWNLFPSAESKSPVNDFMLKLIQMLNRIMSAETEAHY